MIYFSSRKARSIASARLQPPTARRSRMNRIISAVLTASALIFGVCLPGEESVAQTTVIITRSDLPKFASNNRAAELQKKTRQSCRGALPYSVPTRSARQIRPIPSTLRAVRSRIGTGPSENILSTYPGTNSKSRHSLRRPQVTGTVHLVLKRAK